MAKSQLPRGQMTYKEAGRSIGALMNTAKSQLPRGQMASKEAYRVQMSSRKFLRFWDI